MNFYTLDGSKMDSNILFQNKQIFEKFDNIQNQNQTQTQTSLLDSEINDEEEFANVPMSKSNATDTDFQCSDGYSVKGDNFGKQYSNSNLNECKKKCNDGKNNCIGFNFNTKNNICSLKKNVSSMDTNQNSTLCIKKSAGNSGCKVNTKNTTSEPIKAFNDLDSIFNGQNGVSDSTSNSSTNTSNTSNKAKPTKPAKHTKPTKPTNTVKTSNMINDMLDDSKYPMPIPNSNLNPNPNSNTQAIPDNQNMEPENNIGSEMGIEMETQIAKNQQQMNINNPPGVYVDLDCFMKNINVLQNRTDNMMIDLSLLLSNIKTCSYVKKTSQDLQVKDNKMNSKQLLEQITSKIDIPQPDTVNLKNIKADILVSTGTNSPSQIVEITKEPFSTNSQTSNWNYKDLVLIVIIGVLIYLLVLKK